LGIGFVAYSPLGRGLLSGKLRNPEELDAGDYRRTTPGFQDENLKRNAEPVDRIEKIPSEKNCTAAQLALAWVLAQGSDIVPIAGTKRRSYLEENVESVRVTLTPADLGRIDQELPSEMVAGDRYDPIGMNRLNR
jgi:aryl-alcohol dehydrogenase-like predicted oxidoreductase